MWNFCRNLLAEFWNFKISSRSGSSQTLYESLPFGSLTSEKETQEDVSIPAEEINKNKALFLEYVASKSDAVSSLVDQEQPRERTLFFFNILPLLHVRITRKYIQTR